MRKKFFRVLLYVVDSDITCIFLTILLAIILIAVVAEKYPFWMSSCLLAVSLSMISIVISFIIVKAILLKLFDIAIARV